MVSVNMHGAEELTVQPRRRQPERLKKAISADETDAIANDDEARVA
jgi:hypothetical protein